MSNKHWCMPKYPILDLIRSDHPEWSHVKDERLLSWYAQKYKDAGKESDAVVTIAEAYLINDNSPCLFLESKQLIQFLNDSTYSRGIFVEAVKEFSYRHICFPAVSINGINLRPCAFGISERIISAESGVNTVIFSCALKKCTDFRIWSAKYIDEILTTKEEIDHKNFTEDSIAYLHLRLCMASVVYAAAFPDYIHDGLPVNVKASKLKKPRILTAAPEILEGATRTSVSMHIRAGHFKTLQHERFKRNQDGSAKIIFVRQTVVAGKLTPKTAVEP